MAPNWLIVLACDANKVQIVTKGLTAFRIQKFTDITFGSLYQWHISLA